MKNASEWMQKPIYAHIKDLCLDVPFSFIATHLSSSERV